MSPLPPRRPFSRASIVAASRRGFTLVELMVVVAMIGILAALAIQGVTLYIQSSKGAEAKANVGAIGRSVVAAGVRLTNYDTEPELNNSSGSSKGKGKGKGSNGATVYSGVFGLCNDANPVPASLNAVRGRKYQPSTVEGFDYDTGSDTEGWKCLQFEVNQPQYFQYGYDLGGPPISVKLPNGGSPKGAAGSSDRPWSAWARGDVDADGATSWFVLTGVGTEGKITKATAIYEENPSE